jgi:hypothetical protein
MAIDLPTVNVSPQAAVAAALPLTSTFDERWAAWQAKGVAHDLALRRTMSVVLVFALLGR